ncbi:MAG: hypothetical protein E7385_02365 [Ruminococcaceae bacterium]|nr:hypothetical protein [Oscillospiraceae bacterium]
MDTNNNILLIVADEFRYDCQGFAGRAPVITPNIDELAEKGTFFENAYTSIPTCCPARQSFYACKRSESFGAYWNYDITMPIGGLPVDEYSFMRDFQAAGYNTIHVGRSELSPTHDSTEYGYSRHRNTSTEYAKLCASKDIAPPKGINIWEGWTENGELTDTPAGHTAACVIEELRGASLQEAPFFMTVCFTSPHPPYHPHQKFYEMYDKSVKWGGFDDTLADKPYIQRQQVRNWNNESRTWDDWEPIVRKYYAQITELDYHIGKIIDTLKDQGKYENTTIIFTADHGDMCGNHKMFDKHYVLYEDVIHVPLIIKPAQGLCEHRVGRTREYTMHNLDLGPTLMELHGIRPSGRGLHGISFTGVLSGGRSARNEAVSTLNGAQFGLFTQRCIKTDRWKYIWNPTDTDELYDLTVDPWEVDNRINDPECRDSVAFLRKQLLEILCREGDPFCVIGRGWAARKHLEENRKI